MVSVAAVIITPVSGMGWMVAQSAQDFDGPRILTFDTLESLHGALGIRKSGRPE
jgi:hypothetical protein